MYIIWIVPHLAYSSAKHDSQHNFTFNRHFNLINDTVTMKYSKRRLQFVLLNNVQKKRDQEMEGYMGDVDGDVVQKKHGRVAPKKPDFELIGYLGDVDSDNEGPSRTNRDGAVGEDGGANAVGVGVLHEETDVAGPSGNDTRGNSEASVTARDSDAMGSDDQLVEYVEEETTEVKLKQEEVLLSDVVLDDYTEEASDEELGSSSAVQDTGSSSTITEAALALTTSSMDLSADLKDISEQVFNYKFFTFVAIMYCSIAVCSV